MGHLEKAGFGMKRDRKQLQRQQALRLKAKAKKQRNNLCFFLLFSIQPISDFFFYEMVEKPGFSQKAGSETSWKHEPNCQTIFEDGYMI